MWRLSKLNWQEATAYAASVLLLVVGLYLGSQFEPAWIGRAGSLVIVCGVLLAASRKIEILRSKVKTLIETHRSEQFSKLLAEFTNPDGTPITKEQSEVLKHQIYGEAQEEIGELIDKRHRIFKLHEVFLVVLGTIVNGFGEWALILAIKYGT